MALRSGLSNYANIRRPSLSTSSGGFSSYAQSLVKKQNSAEDAIIDQQYQDGVLSAESYRTELSKRLSRSYLTPLQQVTIQQKIGDVTQNLADAEVDRRYASGELSTDQVLKYEQSKLQRISQTDTVAYQNQAKKVQGLIDKSEREKRNNFRVQENLRISQMPEDTSDRLLAKASAYEKLAAQARIDGDNQAADVFETSKNNYVQSARRAGINDLITGARLNVSGTPRAGLGVPTAGAGQQFLTGSSQAGGGVGQAQPSASGVRVTGGGGVSSSAITNAYKSLDRSQKTIERLYQQKQDKATLIQAYQNAVDQAEGDQKTQLTIALNNLVDEDRGIDSQIANAEQGVQDTIGRIGELQQKAAFSNFKQQAKQEGTALDSAEKDLEQKLRTGKISKQDYLRESVNLIASMKQYKEWAANNYREFGDDTTADKLLEDIEYKLSNTEASQLHDQLLNVVSTVKDPKKQQQAINEVLNRVAGNYELYRVPPGGTLDNISGTQKKPGELTLRNFQNEKDLGVFDGSYIRDKDGVYSKIRYQGEQNPLTGDFLSTNQLKDRIQLGQGKSPFYYDATGKKVPIGLIEVKKADGTVQYVAQPKSMIDQRKNIYEPVSVSTAKGLKAPSDMLYKIKESPKVNQPFQPLGAYTPDFGRIPKVIQGKEPLFAPGSPGAAVQNFVQKNVIDRFKQVTQPKSLGFINQATQNIGKTISGAAGNLARFFQPKAYAAESTSKPKVEVRPEQVDPNDFDSSVKYIASKYGIPEGAIRAVAAAETGAGRGEEAKTVGTHNYFNIGAFDSNPLNASHYQNALQGVEAFAKLIKNDPRYKAAYNSRGNPIEFVKQLEKAGYAGDPRTYAQRATNDFGSYSDFIFNTPEFRNFIGTIKATPTPTVKPQTGLTAMIKRIRTEKPQVKLTDQQIAEYYKKYGENLYPAQGQAISTVTQTPLRSTPTPTPQVRSQQQPQAVRPSQPSFNPVQAVQSVAQNIGNYFTKPIAQPKIISPIPNFKQPAPQTGFQSTLSNIGRIAAPIVQTVQKAAAPVVKNVQSTVQKAISNVGSFLNNLNPFRKR